MSFSQAYFTTPPPPHTMMSSLIYPFDEYVDNMAHSHRHDDDDEYIRSIVKKQL